MPISVHTMDFVMHEIKDLAQSEAIAKCVASKRLTVGHFTVEELNEVYTSFATAEGNVSLTDCAVWHYAKSSDYILLTGDKQLRNRASESHVTVRGILYVFDLLMEHKILSTEDIVEKLRRLQEVNIRLPKKINSRTN